MSRSLSWTFLAMTILLNAAASPEGMGRMIVAGTSMGWYGLAFLTYYEALRNFPVSVAYPVITSGTIMTIVLIGACLLGESLSNLKLLGAVLVIVGVFIFMRA